MVTLEVSIECWVATGAGTFWRGQAYQRVDGYHIWADAVGVFIVGIQRRNVSQRCLVAQRWVSSLGAGASLMVEVSWMIL